MRMPGALWMVLGLALLLGAGVALAVTATDPGPPQAVLQRDRPAKAIALGVLGDSNSHSYHDRLAFPPGSGGRGGAQIARTFNWPEVLARLRGSELDPGPWLEWGSANEVSGARRAVGLPVGRVPRKEDYLYNFAVSGAGCDDLTTGRLSQARHLALLMDKEPERWRRAVVVIYIGLADWIPLLELQARDPDAPQLQQTIDRCVARQAEAIAAVRERHPEVRFLIAGLVNEIDDPGQFEHFRSAGESRNVDLALGRFNAALRGLAERTPGAAFFDSHAWFRKHWGSRGPDGLPNAYRTVTIGSFQVSNTVGDEPRNALVADYHAGTVWNALWAQAVVQQLKDGLGLSLTPVTDAELWRYLQPLVAPAGLKAPGS